MVIMTLNLILSPENKAEAITIIKSIAGPTSAVKGCAGFHLYREVGNDESLMLCEEWESMETIKHHIQSREFHKILAVMELAKSGAVTNRKKGQFKGRSLTAYALGSEELMQFLDKKYIKKTAAVVVRAYDTPADNGTDCSA